MEPGESLQAAAVRQTGKETGLVVTATLSCSVNAYTPKTGRRMACDIVNGTAYVAADDELTDLA